MSIKIGKFYDDITAWFFKYSELSKTSAILDLEEKLQENIEALSEKDAKSLLYYHLRRQILNQFIDPMLNPLKDKPKF